MSQIKTSRPFQQRFLDGYDRSQLRQDIQKLKPRRLTGLGKKYATWALGASLALGGLGIPMKVIRDAAGSRAADSAARPGQLNADAGIRADLAEAARIAQQVGGGLQVVARAATETTARPLQAVAGAPESLKVITESAKESFFRKEIPFGSLIYAEAKKNNVPPELVAAVAHTESKFNPTARSHAGAVGLMQLVPRTGRWMGARDLTNPAQNISAGTKYLKYLNERFDGDQQKVIAAYNAGEGNVRRFRGVPPFKETRQYVKRVRSFEQDLNQRLESHVQEQMEIASAE